MKNLITIFVSLLMTGTMNAMCAFGGIHCLSQSGTLNQNGLIILEFYSVSKAVVPQLNKKHPIYLMSQDQQVALAIVEVLQGDFAVTAVLLKPATQLTVGSTYTLHIDSLSGDDRLRGRYDEALKKTIPLTFVIQEADYKVPVFAVPPRKAGSNFTAMGCGPREYVDFKVEGKDDSDLFVRTVVRRKGKSATTTYIIAINADTVSIGHGMCGGPFRFDDAKHYEVSFQLVDQSGNTSAATTFIPFKRPRRHFR